MNPHTTLPLLAASILLTTSPSSPALPPAVINHQGRIAVDGTNYTGTGHFKFALVDASGQQTFWTNDGTRDAEPTGAVPVPVSNGHYSLGLGDTALPNMTSDLTAILFQTQDALFLRTWFAIKENGPFELLAPDRRLTSSPYALHAASAATLPDGSITAAMLAAGSVTGDKLAAGSITTNALAPGAVSGLDSPDGTLTNALRADLNGRVEITGGTSGGNGMVPPRFIPLDSVAFGDFLEILAVEGDYAFAYDMNDDVIPRFDLSDPTDLRLSGFINLNTRNTRDLAVEGVLAYSSDAGLTLYDVSDPVSMTVLDSVPAANFWDLDIEGTFVYVLDYAGGAGAALRVFDFSEPTNIIARGTSGAVINGAADLVVEGNFAYVTDDGNNSLQIFDVSNPDTIVTRGAHTTILDEPSSLAVKNRLVYVADRTVGFQIFDASDPDNILARGAHPTDLTSPDHVVVAGNLAFVGAFLSDQIQIFDVSDPDAVLALTTIDLGPLSLESGGLAVQGRIAYVADRNGRLHSYEIGPALALHGSLQLVHGAVIYADGSQQTRAFGIDAVGSAEIADGSITSADIQDGAIQGEDLADEAVTSAKIANGTIRSFNLDPSSVGIWFPSGNNVYRTFGQVGIGTSTPVSPLHVVGDDFPVTVEKRTSATNNLQVAVRAQLTTTGDMIDGFGPTIGFNIRDSSDTTSSLGGVGAVRAGADNTGDLVFYNRVAGSSRERMRLDSQGTLSIDQELRVGTEFSNDDDSIFFDDGSSERLFWDNSETRFEFSDNLEIKSGGSTPQLRLEQTSTTNFARLELATVDGGNWQIAAQSGATGDLRFYNGSTNRMVLEDNGNLDIDGTLSQGSDRNRKENIAPVDPVEILAKVAELPITRWNYTDDAHATPHLGPMSQDFRAAFQVGDDETRIPSVDADGVALAAIQGLNKKLEATNKDLQAENAALRRRLERLEQLVNRILPVEN